MFLLLRVVNIVAIVFSPPLAYCTIFVIVSTEVIDLHIGIFICTSHYLHLCTRMLHAATAARHWLAADPVSDLVFT